MDTIDILTVVCKFAGIACSGIFGVIGLLHEYRDKSGKITKWGHFALRGMIISFVIAAAAETFDLAKGRRERNESLAKTRRELEQSNLLLGEVKEVLNQTRRNMELVDLSKLDVNFTLHFSARDPDLKPYVARLDQELAKLETEHQDDLRNVYYLDGGKYEFIPRRATQGFRPGFIMVPQSGLWPVWQKEPAAERLFGYFLLFIVISNDKTLRPIGDPANIVLQAGFPLTGRQQGGDVESADCKLGYFPKESEFVLQISDASLVINRRNHWAFLSKLDYEDKAVTVIHNGVTKIGKFSYLQMGFGDKGSLPLDVQNPAVVEGNVYYKGKTERSKNREP